MIKIKTNLEIKKYLKEIGMTQIYLSKKAKIPAPKLNLALNGERKLTLEEYASICWAFGVSKDKFLKPMMPEKDAV